MAQRLDYSKIAPEGVKILHSLEKYVKESGLEPSLLELVKIRTSQINHCAYCIDMHTKDARTKGESEQRIYGLSAWHESPFYSRRERAALAWGEAVTRVNKDKVSNATYAQVRKVFTEKELVDLTFAILAINSWNRLAISFRTEPGSYKPDHPIVAKQNSRAVKPSWNARQK